LGFIERRFTLTTRPALLNILSLSVEVAGGHNYFKKHVVIAA